MDTKQQLIDNIADYLDDMDYIDVKEAVKLPYAVFRGIDRAAWQRAMQFFKRFDLVNDSEDTTVKATMAENYSLNFEMVHVNDGQRLAINFGRDAITYRLEIINYSYPSNAMCGEFQYDNIPLNFQYFLKLAE